jgi:hypothetical protein
MDADMSLSIGWPLQRSVLLPVPVCTGFGFESAMPRPSAGQRGGTTEWRPHQLERIA